MAQAKKITPLALSKMTKPGRYAVGEGAYLQIARGGTKAWLFRYTVNGKAGHMGLGSFDLVSLAEARERARDARKKILGGVDPLQAKRQAKASQRAAVARQLTFKACAEQFIESKEIGWKNEKHRQQWKNTLATYVYTVIGHVPVGEIDTAMVQKVLSPIWKEKPETAARIRGRIEKILDAAKVTGARSGENPARWVGHLDQIFTHQRKVRKIRNHPAMPYAALPAFMKSLRATKGTSARALEFAILTASRTAEVLGAKWSEIDLGEAVWTIPEDRMKAKRPHRVPLSADALALLNSLPRSGEFVFGGRKEGKPLSNMAMLELMRDMTPDYVPHGFRSTFRDWAGEVTHHPREVAEAALAHVIGDKAEQAYRRGDALEKRRALMTDWSTYCEGASPNA